MYMFTTLIKTLRINCYNNIGILVLAELLKYFHCAYMIYGTINVVFDQCIPNNIIY